MSILEALRCIPPDTAVSYVKTYYETPFDGAHFDTLDQKNFIDSTNLITGSDLYALTLMQARVQRTPGAKILFELSEEISCWLEQLPNVPLEDLSEEQFDKYLGNKVNDGHTSPGQELWKVLTGVKGVGPTIASKIMARKRPALIPIYDSFIYAVTKVSNKHNWRAWWEAFRQDGDELRERADLLLNAIDRKDLSRLRVLDVMFWSSRKYGLHSESSA